MLCYELSYANVFKKNNKFDEKECAILN